MELSVVGNKPQIVVNKELVESCVTLASLVATHLNPSIALPYYLNVQLVDYACETFKVGKIDWSTADSALFHSILAASQAALSILQFPSPCVISLGMFLTTQTARQKLISSSAFKQIKKELKKFLVKSAIALPKMGIKTAFIGCAIGIYIASHIGIKTLLNDLISSDLKYLENPYLVTTAAITTTSVSYLRNKTPLAIASDIYSKSTAYSAATSLFGSIGSAAIFALGSTTKQGAMASLSVGAVTYLMTQSPMIASMASIASQALLESPVLQQGMQKISSFARSFF